MNDYCKNRFSFAFADAVVIKEKLIPVEAGNISTLPHGSNVDVTVRQESDKLLLDFAIPSGKDGKDGVDGINGKDGIDGKDGVDGKDGIDGKDGVDGKDGRDGNEVSVDAELSLTSHNPVENRAVTGRLNEKLDLPLGIPEAGKAVIYDGDKAVWGSIGGYTSALVAEKAQDGVASKSIGELASAYSEELPVMFKDDIGYLYLSELEQKAGKSALTVRENYDVTNLNGRDITATIQKEYLSITPENASTFGAVTAHNVFLDGYTDPTKSSFIAMAPINVSNPGAADTSSLDLRGAIASGLQLPFIAFHIASENGYPLKNASLQLYCELNPSIFGTGHTQMGVFASSSLSCVAEDGFLDFSKVQEVATIGDYEYTNHRFEPYKADLSEAIALLGGPTELYLFVVMYSGGSVMTGNTDVTLSGYSTNYGARFFGLDLIGETAVKSDSSDYKIVFRSLGSPCRIIEMQGKESSLLYTEGIENISGEGMRISIIESSGMLSSDKGFSEISSAIQEGKAVSLIYSGRLYYPAHIASSMIYFTAARYYLDIADAVISIDSSGNVSSLVL